MNQNLLRRLNIMKLLATQSVGYCYKANPRSGFSTLQASDSSDSDPEDAEG